MHKTILLSLLTIVSFFTVQGQVKISEIMQSNIDAVYVWPEFPDSWVELHNEGSSTINLTGYKIGIDNESIDCAFTLTDDKTLASDGFRLIYCDKEAKGMHTHFRLNADGGTIQLYDPEGELIDEITYPGQPSPNVAYALVDGQWGYAVIPTPSNSNNTTLSDILLPAPIFSLPSQVLTEGDPAFDVTVSVPDLTDCPSDTRLCITTDGREPVMADAIDGYEWTYTVEHSVAIRAKLVSSEALLSTPVTRSYLFTPEPTTLDVVAIVTPDKYFFDKEFGLFGDLASFSEARRPFNIEYLQGPEHTSVFNQMGEGRIHGRANRTMPQKSLAIYANKRFGKKNFKASLWTDKPQVTKVKSFLMRNGGSAWPYQRINDQLAQTLIGRAKNVEWQAYTPALYFINGKYMGITDIRERCNDVLIESNYPDIESMDMIENFDDIKVGSIDALNELLDYCESENLTAEGLADRLDLDNFIDILTLNVFCHNTDYPLNNHVIWRRTDILDSPFRLAIKDMDLSGIWTFQKDSIQADYFAHLDRKANHPTQGRNALMYKFCYTDPMLREKLIDRIAVALGDYLREDHAIAVMDEMNDALAPHYFNHMAMYYPTWGYKDWVYCNQQWKNIWWPQRIEAVYNILAKRFHLGNPIPMTVDYDSNLDLAFNGVPLALSHFNGKFFRNRAVVLSSLSNKNARWYVTFGSSKLDFMEMCVVAPELHFSVPDNCNNVAIRVESADDSAIESLTPESMSLNHTYYDLSGRKITSPRPGRMYIDASTGKVCKVFCH